MSTPAIFSLSSLASCILRRHHQCFWLLLPRSLNVALCDILVSHTDMLKGLQRHWSADELSEFIFLYFLSCGGCLKIIVYQQSQCIVLCHATWLLMAVSNGKICFLVVSARGQVQFLVPLFFRFVYIRALFPMTACLTKDSANDKQLVIRNYEGYLVFLMFRCLYCLTNSNINIFPSLGSLFLKPFPEHFDSRRSFSVGKTRHQWMSTCPNRILFLMAKSACL